MEGKSRMAAREIYLNGDYLQRNPGWHVDAAPWKADAILRMMEKNQLLPSSVCEIGCGAGEILHILQQKSPSVRELIGYEIAPQAYELARSRENEHLHFRLADFREQDHNTYDLILLIDVLQHFEDWFGYLKKIKTQSEYKILQLPIDVTVSSALHNELVEYYHDAGHVHFFSKDVALKLLQECGYEILDYFYTLPPLDTTTWAQVRGKPRKMLRKLVRLIKRGLQHLPGRLLYIVDRDLAVRIFGGWRLMILLH